MESVHSIIKMLACLQLWQILLTGVLARVLVCLSKLPFRLELGSLSPETLFQRGNDGFIQLAYNLLHYGTYTFQEGGGPVPFRPPVVPLLMIPFGAIWPEHWYLLWILAVGLIGGGTIWLTHSILSEMGVRPGIRIFGTALVALHPYLIYASWTPNAVATTIFTTTLAFWFFVRAWKRGGFWMAGLGLALGLACLTHGSSQVLVPCFCLALLTRPALIFSRRLRDAVLVGLVCLLTLAPWTLRNYRTFDLFIPVATGSGLQYWLGEKNYNGTFTTLEESFQEIKNQYGKEWGLDLVIEQGGLMDPAMDNRLASLALKDLRDDFSRAVIRYTKGVGWFWAYNPRGFMESMVKALTSLPVLIPALILLFLAYQRRSVLPIAYLGYTLVFVQMSLFAIIQATEVYYLFTLPLLICSACLLLEKMDFTPLAERTP